MAEFRIYLNMACPFCDGCFAVGYEGDEPVAIHTEPRCEEFSACKGVNDLMLKVKAATVGEPGITWPSNSLRKN